ncbi:hypothetical protein CW735_12360 [Alteromonas sp. MB-3u-76]|uniref:hypothetical protein n=1 Tax=Alteromonas sp. MB-3u-76 TaxID=2058133 RepID=UPI000C30CF11|nr:hypothetical protein [Alteromonas sp. MB-3u-76]AUC88881.1 hypothetical protein CW735_12360 [Alteromonas sp. MB-3u-76]
MNKAIGALDRIKEGAAKQQTDPLKSKTDKAYSFPSCPRHIKGAEKKVWSEVRKEMEVFELITGADKAILEQYCFLMAQLREQPSEFTASLHAQLRGLANDLYLTPESRRKAKLSIAEDDDPLKKYGM